MLIAEDLLLLLMDAETGKPLTDGTKLDHALAGALLLELALAGRVDVARREGIVPSDRIAIADRSPFGDPILDDALAKATEREGQKPQKIVGPLAKGVRTRLLRSLRDRGILREERHRVLGLFPTTRWPASGVEHERQLVTNLDSVLRHGTTPDERGGALISLLSAIDAAPKALGREDDSRADRKALRERAKQIAKESWASGAVQKAVEAVNAATMAAVTAAVVGGGS